MTERNPIYINKARQLLQGNFYPDGPGSAQVRRKLFSFAELGWDAEGNSTPKSLPQKKEKKLIEQRYKEAERTLLLEPRKVNAPGEKLKQALQAWLDWGRYEREITTQMIMTQVANELIGSLTSSQRLNLGVAEFKMLHADRWIITLRERQLQPATINIHIRTINAFFNWAFKREMYEKRFRIELVKAPIKKPKILNQAQISKLLAHLKTLIEKNPEGRYRRCYRLHLRVLIMLLFTGARRQEIFWLQWKDIDMAKGIIYIRHKKSFTVKEGTEKKLQIAPLLHAFLTNERALYPEEEWFLDDGKGELMYASPNGITLAMRRHFAKLGFTGEKIKPLHGHRAGFITLLANQEVDIAIIQQLVGHSNISVTQGYLSNTDGMVNNALSGINWGEGVKILDNTRNNTRNKK